MKFRENDVIVSIVNISSVIRKGTKGVILSILEEDKVFLVEFVDEKGDTIGNEMETVYAYQIIRCN
ncbi:MAG: DUF4926 domain-containing protein [Flavobacteriaceae bacterium]